jgi:hypothetical protein
MDVMVSAGICGPVHAQVQPVGEEARCPKPVVTLIGEHFGIDNLAIPEIPGEERKPGDIVAATCSAWPENTQQTLAVFAYHDPKLVDEQRVPLIVNVRRDPFERAQYNSNTYYDWFISHAFLLYEMQALVAAQIDDFAKFPPRQKPAAFNLDEVMRQVTTHHQ